MAEDEGASARGEAKRSAGKSGSGTTSGAPKKPTGKKTSAKKKPAAKKSAGAARSSAKRSTTTAGAAKKKPAAKKPAPKKPQVKKKSTQPKLMTPADSPVTGTFMPAEVDPLDEPTPTTSTQALLSKASAPHMISPGLGENDMAASVMAPPKSSLADLDRRERMAKALSLDTTNANQNAWAGLIIASTTAVALIALITTEWPGWAYTLITLLGLGTGVGAAWYGVRGWNLSLRGDATNGPLSLAVAIAGAVLVVGILVVVLIYTLGEGRSPALPADGTMSPGTEHTTDDEVLPDIESRSDPFVTP